MLCTSQNLQFRSAPNGSCFMKDVRVFLLNCQWFTLGLSNYIHKLVIALSIHLHLYPANLVRRRIFWNISDCLWIFSSVTETLFLLGSIWHCKTTLHSFWCIKNVHKSENRFVFHRLFLYSIIYTRKLSKCEPSCCKVR